MTLPQDMMWVVGLAEHDYSFHKVGLEVDSVWESKESAEARAYRRMVEDTTQWMVYQVPCNRDPLPNSEPV